MLQFDGPGDGLDRRHRVGEEPSLVPGELVAGGAVRNGQVAEHALQTQAWVAGDGRRQRGGVRRLGAHSTHAGVDLEVHRHVGKVEGVGRRGHLSDGRLIDHRQRDARQQRASDVVYVTGG